MDSNILIIIIGGMIILLTLIILLKGGSKEEEEYSPETLLALKNASGHNPQNQLNYLAIMEGIAGLKDEITYIKGEMERLSGLLETHEHKNLINTDSGLTNFNNWENFDQSLNYNMFLQKNNDILDLSKDGKSPEEIARRLNKSIREVEMVIKLIK